MKCKRCKRVIADNSIYCNWCGHKQLTDSTEIRVPVPKHKGNAWYAQVTVDGERVYISGDTEEDYYAKARATKSGLIDAKKAAPKLTLGTAIDRFIRDRDAVLSPSTIKSYKSYRAHRLADYMDTDVNAINYQRMVNEESKRVSPKTIHNLWRLVMASLKHAGIPVPSVNLPQKTKADRPWLDYQQIQTLLAVCKDKPYELGVVLGLHGLRRSEILHLTADDIDLSRGVIHVRGASVIGSNGRLVDKDTNKTSLSTRDVHIVIPRLNSLISGLNGRLITDHPNTLYREVNAVCLDAGLPLVGVHGLRHSFASLAYHLQWSEATTMREGGWSNPDTVHKIYTHLAAQDANEDIRRMKRFYGMG